MLRCNIQQVFTVSWSSPDGASVEFQPKVEKVADEHGNECVFFEFGKWCTRALAKACLGKALKHGDRDATINVEFIDSLVRKRKAACNAAFAEAIAVPGQENAKRRRRAPVCTERSATLLPDILAIHCDGFVDEHGAQAPMSFRVLSRDFTTSNVWIELKADVLDFLTRAIRHDLGAARFGRSRGTERGNI